MTEWKIEGIIIGTADVIAEVDTPITVSSPIVTTHDRLVSGALKHRRITEDFRSASFTVNLIGDDADDVGAEAEFIRGLLRDAAGGLFALEADENIWRDRKRLALKLEGIEEELLLGDCAWLKLTIAATLEGDGDFVADGGESATIASGYATYDGANWIDQDGNNLGANVDVQVPEQATGYPLALDNVAFVYDDLAPQSTALVNNRDPGAGRTYDTYRLDPDHAWPRTTSPSSGDVVVWDLRVSPSQDWLDNTT